MEKENWHIVIGSPVDYEELTAEVVIDDKYVLLLQKEEGVDKMIVEFYHNGSTHSVYLETLLNALQKAKRLLEK